MSTRVDYEKLVEALEWVSSGEAVHDDCGAYVSKLTGDIYRFGEGVDEELPDDIEDDTRYVAVPGKRELDLARSLALRFVQDKLPDKYEGAREYFRHKGAYPRFKASLDASGQLEAWYRYEQQAIEDALREWGKEHGFVLDRPRGSKDV